MRRRMVTSFTLTLNGEVVMLKEEDEISCIIVEDSCCSWRDISSLLQHAHSASGGDGVDSSDIVPGKAPF